MALGASINAVDSRGMTPLHDAATAKNLRICKDLCVKGADRNALNKDDQTPIQLLKDSGDKKDIENFSQL